MPNVDLRKFSEAELRDLVKRANKALRNKQSAARRRFIQDTRTRAEELGIELSDIAKAKGRAPRKKRQLTPKYANPADPKQTWTGVGRAPKWAQPYRESGRLHEIAIKK